MAPVGRLVICGLVAATAASGAALAREAVPLPLPRPTPVKERSGEVWPRTIPGQNTTIALAPMPERQGLDIPAANVGPTACTMRLENVARFTPLPVLMGPGACGATDVVRLEAVNLPDNKMIALNPPATLRCEMAEAVALFVRDDVVPATIDVAASAGSAIAAIAAYDSFECRGRNRVVGAKLSEHGKANAIDVKGVRLANGKTLGWTELAVAQGYRERMKAAACGRFNTVLGPGSDGYHEEHIHLDLAQRSRGYKMCQWDVREPGEPGAVPVAEVPLPLPRPVAFTPPEERRP